MLPGWSDEGAVRYNKVSEPKPFGVLPALNLGQGQRWHKSAQ